eukprot:NODE_731_length_4356_cov_0.328870.p1 type:complete len:645 gc:universal NODE_731_length_4356_cov_0.328870:2750-816(-)
MSRVYNVFQHLNELSPISLKHMSKYFKVEKNDSESIFVFPDVPCETPNHFPLRSIVRSFTSMKQASQIQSKFLFYILGRLDWLTYMINEYNKGIEQKVPEDDIYFNRYIKFQVVQGLSGLGFQIKLPNTPLAVPGLDELKAEIRNVHKSQLEYYAQIIKDNAIVFDALSELYKPGLIVRGITSLGVPAGFRVVQSYFQERKSLFGFEQSFHLELQYVVTLGADFTVVQFEVVLSRWMGEANRKINEMFYAPVDEAILKRFVQSGEKYVALGQGESKYLQHDAGCVFLHSHAKNQSKPNIVQTPGRIMIDVVRGAALGHHASQGMDDATHALIEITGRYKRYKNEQKSLGESSSNPDSIFILSSVPKELLGVTWPALVGFSFQSKNWCHVLVQGLKPIKFNDSAFNELVLDPKRKRLIRALVRFGGDQVQDIIEGKSGGSIFLLHGPAGVGKTLTAEAIAEVLHKPLYYVTMGELGTDPTTMEQRLAEILELCSGWNALTLIDEADVFLEKRDSNDILKNAMTCVMLRLLEYHPGILFLTTNRVTEFDPALESRVTVALKYTSLTPQARSQVWKNMTARVNCEVKELNYEKLGEYPLNGRQIKNAVRLAVALAMDSKEPLDQDLIEETVAVTNIGRSEMQNASKW